MMKKINNKGFTLVEVLAVLVILSAIMAIALPSITSSMERNKSKQDESKKEMLAAFAEIYVADHRNGLYNWMSANGNRVECFIKVDTLRNEGLLSDDADKDSNGNWLNGNIYFNRTKNLYVYSDNLKFEIEKDNFVTLTNADECNLS